MSQKRLRIVWELGLSIFGLTGTHQYGIAITRTYRFQFQGSRNSACFWWWKTTDLWTTVDDHGVLWAPSRTPSWRGFSACPLHPGSPAPAPWTDSWAGRTSLRGILKDTLHHWEWIWCFGSIMATAIADGIDHNKQSALSSKSSASPGFTTSWKSTSFRAVADSHIFTFWPMIGLKENKMLCLPTPTSSFQSMDMAPHAQSEQGKRKHRCFGEGSSKVKFSWRFQFF